MLEQKDIKILREIFSDYDYIMTTAQLNAEKLYYRDIQRMLDEGLIEKIKRGYYHWIEDDGNSEIVIINSLFSIMTSVIRNMYPNIFRIIFI